MKSRLMGGLLCLLLAAAGAHAEEGTRLLRYPDIHGDQVVPVAELACAGRGMTDRDPVRAACEIFGLGIGDFL